MIKEPIKQKVQRISAHPTLRRSVTSIKPARSVWGFLGVVLFFILPEIIAFVWGTEITAYARHQMMTNTAEPYQTWYWMLEMVFEDGGSWINLSIGLALLVWLFF